MEGIIDRRFENADQRLGIDLRFAELHGAHPVSYTHLDVYKRQLIHLRNMTALTEAGAVVLPASPGFYARPSSIEELCRSVTERVTALFGISGPRYRWTGEGRSAGRNDSDSEK